MEFLRPTWNKLFIAIILTIWPYIAGFMFLLHANDGSIFTDKLVQFSFWEHAWHWSPLYLIVQLFPKAEYNYFWQSNIFLFFLYPLVRFIFRYLAACTIIYFIAKYAKRYSHRKAESS